MEEIYKSLKELAGCLSDEKAEKARKAISKMDKEDILEQKNESRSS